MKRPSQTILTAYCLLLTVYCLLAATAVHAQTSTDLTTLAVANQLYENGRYTEAAQTYQQLVDQGIRDSTLFYNLGNAYYRQDDVGRAILNYERAARLAPRDADIRANLQLASQQVADSFATDESLIAPLADFTQTWLTLPELGGLALGVWLLFCGLWLLCRRRRTSWLQGLLALTAVLCLATAFLLGSRLYLEKTRPFAIVVAAETAVTSGPGAEYTPQITLHSGTAVTLLDQRSQWTRIALPNGQIQGWVPSAAVTAVDTK